MNRNAAVVNKFQGNPETTQLGKDSALARVVNTAVPSGSGLLWKAWSESAREAAREARAKGNKARLATSYALNANRQNAYASHESAHQFNRDAADAHDKAAAAFRADGNDAKATDHDFKAAAFRGKSDAHKDAMGRFKDGADKAASTDDLAKEWSDEAREAAAAARQASGRAEMASHDARMSGKTEDHIAAVEAHDHARNMNGRASDQFRVEGYPTQAGKFREIANNHDYQAEQHSKIVGPVKSTHIGVEKVVLGSGPALAVPLPVDKSVERPELRKAWSEAARAAALEARAKCKECAQATTAEQHDAAVQFHRGASLTARSSIVSSAHLAAASDHETAARGIRAGDPEAWRDSQVARDSSSKVASKITNAVKPNYGSARDQAARDVGLTPVRGSVTGHRYYE